MNQPSAAITQGIDCLVGIADLLDDLLYDKLGESADGAFLKYQAIDTALRATIVDLRKNVEALQA